MNRGKETLLLFAVMFLPGFITQTGVVDPSGWNSIDFNVAILAVAVPQILLVVYVTELRTPGFSSRLGWQRVRLRDIVSAALATVALFAALALLSGLLMVLSEDSSFLRPAVDWSFSRLGLLPLVIAASVAVGYREEIFYRAYLICRGEEAGIHPLLLVFGPAVLFASGHLYQGWIGFLVSFVIGIVLAGVFLWRRSLHGIALAHGIYNATVLVLSAVR